jgi:glycosyltransferase involved in cell wall biosynthesis
VFEYGFPTQGGLASTVKEIVKLIYAHCDSIAVTSPGFRESVVRYAPQNVRVLYVPQWAPQELLDASASPSGKGRSSSSPEIMFRFAGSIGTMQNLDIVLRAFAVARARDNRLVLEIIGDGSERKRLERLTHELRLNQVFFVGRLPMSEVMPLLKESDFLVLPLVARGTVGKTIPAKFQAYLAAGRPILGILAGAAAEMIKREGLGFLADPGSVDEVAQGFLLAAASTPEQRGAISRRQGEFLAANFDRQKAFDVFVECVS